MSRIVMVISYPDTRLKKEAEALAQNDVDVHVIVWERGWSFPRNDDRYDVCSFHRWNIPFGAENYRVWLFYPLWWLFIVSHLIASEYEAIHAVNFDTFVPALIIAKCRKKKVIYDVFDFYGDMFSIPLRNIIRTVDLSLMPFADGIIIADESRTEQIHRSLSETVIVINNSPQRNAFQRISLPEKTTKDFTLFVGGNIMVDRGVDQLITAVQHLDNVELVVIGYSHSTKLTKKLRQMCSSMTNVSLSLGGVAHEDILGQTAIADLIVAFYDPRVTNNWYASPNKLFEAMMYGKPILVNDGTSMAAIVREERCGCVVPFGEVKAIRETISTLRSDPKLCETLGQNGQAAFNAKYDWTIMEKRLVGFYGRILPA
jgi:glycosyltransferase involved in cell wall biosynthesis